MKILINYADKQYEPARKWNTLTGRYIARFDKVYEYTPNDNYDGGNCLLLDDGEPCVCVQSISLSLMCRWFRVAVLPLDGELAAALLHRGSRKRCAVCGAAFVPKSNRGKYCPGCAGRMKKIKAAERKRKQRQKCHALEPFKPA